MWRANYGALMSQLDLAEEMQEHFKRYRDVLASLPEPAASPVLLQDLIGGSEPVAL